MGSVPSPPTQEYLLWKLGHLKQLKSLNIPQSVVCWYILLTIYPSSLSELSVTSVKVQFREHIFDKLLRTFCSSLNQSCCHRNVIFRLVRPGSHDSLSGSTWPLGRNDYSVGFFNILFWRMLESMQCRVANPARKIRMCCQKKKKWMLVREEKYQCFPHRQCSPIISYV